MNQETQTKIESPPLPSGAPLRRSKVRWIAGVTTVAVIATAVVGAVALSGEDPTEVAVVTPTSTASVERQDLVDTEELTGWVELGSSFSLTAGTSGVLTKFTAEGEVLERGDIVYRVSSEPSETELAQVTQQVESAEAQLASAQLALSKLYEGASRSELAGAQAAVLSAQNTLDDLLNGASSAEIAQAEAQISQAEAGVASAGNAVVSAWTGLLTAQSSYCAKLAGPLNVCTEVDLPLEGSDITNLTNQVADLLNDGLWSEAETAKALLSANAGYDNAVNSLRSAEASLSSARETYARITSGPTVGQVSQAESNLRSAQARLDDLEAGATGAEGAQARASVSSAQALLDTALAQQKAILSGPQTVVLFYGDTPAWRTLSVDSTPGTDITQLEENLAVLGFSAEGALVVDDVFDEATAEAVSSWQTSLGLDPSGEVVLGSVIFAAGPVQMGEHNNSVYTGARVSAGSPLGSLTSVASITTTLLDSGSPEETTEASQRVIAQLPVSERTLIGIGDIVRVELPDGSEIEGEVTEIGSIPLLSDPAGSDYYLEVSIQPAKPIESIWTSAGVDVLVADVLAENALTVPVTALLALAEGGYAVEVVEPDGTTRLVGVEVGSYAEGWVELISDQITEGSEVVVVS